jgi:glycosyltransferase involved in cell wall biosynthesis
VRLIGSVPDLSSQYAAARMLVAPTRYAAGIPLKVVEAAQHGLPAVVTPLVADLLGWRDGVELLVGADAPSFAAAMRRLAADDALWCAISEGARAALARDFAPERFARAVRALVGL